MKTLISTLKPGATFSPALAAVCLATFLAASGAFGQTNEIQSVSSFITALNEESTGTGSGSGGGIAGWTGPGPNQVFVSRLEPIDGAGRGGQQEMTWLGVSTEEAPEVLAAQMGLDPGVGLVASYVATNSPAAKAGLQKNDVLIEFQGQPLVHPMQLRKLVQVRKEGDSVKLTFYRAGKKQTVTATLGKTRPEPAFSYSPAGYNDFFVRRSGDPSGGNPVNESFPNLGNVRIDQKRVQEEVRRSLEQSRRLYEDIARQASNGNGGGMDAMLYKLANGEAAMGDQATITVRSTGQSAKSLVKADESGTIVLVSNPKLHLTAHDKDGKLLFDGQIETANERGQVPPDLWSKVEPLLKKMNSDGKARPGSKPAPLKTTI